MSDNIIPFPKRAQAPEQPPAEAATPAPDPDEGWTLIQIVAKAPPPSR